MRKPSPVAAATNEIETLLDRLLEQTRNPKIVHLIDELWSLWLDADADRVFVNLRERFCSAHESFPCIHVEAIEAERKRLTRLFNRPPSEPIPDSDRLALRAISQAIYGTEVSRG